MNKKSLATAIIAGITGITGVVSVSNAVHINPDNTGQVLIYPYYTTRDGNDTLISVVNTTGDGKALKVRFIEGINSREVRDFNLYLSPFDVWTAAIVEDTVFGGAKFITNDNSCTVPNFFDPTIGSSEGGPFDGGDPSGFTLDSFTGFSNALFPTDNGADDLDRTREGYVEIIEMGTLTDETEGSLTAATHTAVGDNVDANGDPLPADCDQLNLAWNATAGAAAYWVADEQTDMAPPSGGLFGDQVIINVAGARANGVNAVALEAFYVPDDSVDVSIHEEPASPQPDLADAFPAVSSVFLATGTGTPLVVTDDWASTGIPILPVTAVLMTEQVMNQFATESLIAGETEWVITFPTKRFHAFDPGVLAPVEPFTVAFPPAGGLGADAPGIAPEPISVAIFDRNEQVPAGPGLGDVFPSPPPPDVAPSVIALPFEVNVISFADEASAAAGTGSIFGSDLNFNNFDAEALVGETGWFQVSFIDDGQELTNPDSGNVYQGLPATGFAVRSADAGTLQFGNAFEHAYARVITN